MATTNHTTPEPDKQWYICDPRKNVKCRKTSCTHSPAAAYPVCSMTTNKEFEKDL